MIETRGRKEMELDVYRTHVNEANDQNDAQISILQEEKNNTKTSRVKRNTISLKIARI